MTMIKMIYKDDHIDDIKDVKVDKDVKDDTDVILHHYGQFSIIHPHIIGHVHSYHQNITTINQGELSGAMEKVALPGRGEKDKLAEI